MRKMGAVVGILAILFLAGPALAQVFITGPGMVGNPGADDPSVGYSSVELEEKLVSPEVTTAPVQAQGAPEPWTEAWYQLNQMPGV